MAVTSCTTSMPQLSVQLAVSKPARPSLQQAAAFFPAEQGHVKVRHSAIHGKPLQQVASVTHPTCLRESKPQRIPGIRRPITAISDIPNKIKNAVASVQNGHLPFAGEDEPRRGTNGKPLLTTSPGQPVPDDDNSLTVGETGMLTLEDFHLLDKLAHFNRERVPERVVHAKGAGAHGYFQVTQDTTDICKAKVFSGVGKKTPVFARFSNVTGERGFTDVVRDIRGFAWKFYTEEGNWDMVGNNTPVFFVRDPLKFPDLIHALKVLITFSPRGVPDGYRQMDGYGSNTFKMVNAEGKAHWVKLHFESDQGTKNLTHEEALGINAVDPDYATRDLKEAIDRREFPSWTFYIQVMPLEEADQYKWDPFDATKVWLKEDYPLREVGRLVLDRTPSNYHAEVEQVAFSPAHMPPGIEPSPDRILQARLFAYDDTARHRIGPNFMQVPINQCPFAKVQNYQRDGPMVVTDNGGARQNYYPNSFDDLPQPDLAQPDITPYSHPGGTVYRYTPQRWRDQDDFEQPRLLWRKVMTEDVKDQTVKNIANHLGQAMPLIQLRQIELFRKVDGELTARVAAAIANRATSSGPRTLIA